MLSCPASRFMVKGVALSVAGVLFFLLASVAAEEEEADTPSEDPKPAATKKAKKKVAADPAEAGGEAPPGAKDGGKGPAKKLSLDEKYVEENLEASLHPTALEFHDDGRVTIRFDFTEKKEEHESLFTPKVSRDINQRFRWTVSAEERYLNGTGLRIANDGAAYLNLWFSDDVEAEITYMSGMASSKKQTAALVFTSQAGKSIGTDHGLLCVTYAGGKQEKGANGTFEVLPRRTLAKFKLLVRGGKFEAWRDGRQKEAADYKPKDFASGRIGFVWGNVAGFINRLDITGRLDMKKMAAELKKRKK